MENLDLDLQLFKVGGAVRDDILGLRTKDIDFVAVVDRERFDSVEAGFAHLERELVRGGFKIFLSTPEYATVRAQFPAAMRDMFGGVRDADFVLSRVDGPSSDGRRPDFVQLGTLDDDLMRRDFTTNAMAQGADGSIVDLGQGMADTLSRTLRFVGDPMQRIREDALRVMRALRFVVTKGFVMAPETRAALCDPTVPAMLARISDERRADELDKMLSFDTLDTLALIATLPTELVEAMMGGRVRLSATLRKGRR